MVLNQGVTVVLNQVDKDTRALYEGSLAEPGDRNPYAGRSLVLAKLWMHGYRRMLIVRVNSGPAMQAYFATQGPAEHTSS